MLNHTKKKQNNDTTNDEGESVENYEQVKAMAVDYYKDLFTKKGEFNEKKRSTIRMVINKFINKEQLQELQALITEQEIMKTMLKMKNKKLQFLIVSMLNFTRKTRNQQVKM